MKNIKHFLSIGFLSLLLLNCSSVQDKPNEIAPPHLISQEKMIVVLADIQITEAYLKDLRKQGNIVKDTALLYYERVFKKNEITKTAFEESILYYKQDLEHLDKIYTLVITRLNELKAKNEEIILLMKADSARQDSIKHAEFILDSIQQLNDSTVLTNKHKENDN